MLIDLHSLSRKITIHKTSRCGLSFWKRLRIFWVFVQVNEHMVLFAQTQSCLFTFCFLLFAPYYVSWRPFPSVHTALTVPFNGFTLIQNSVQTTCESLLSFQFFAITKTNAVSRFVLSSWCRYATTGTGLDQRPLLCGLQLWQRTPSATRKVSATEHRWRSFPWQANPP